MGKRKFGSIRQLASSKRWQARYTGPDGRTYTAGVTFDAAGYADAWLAHTWAEIRKGTWTPPITDTAVSVIGAVSLREYSAAWLAGRELSPATKRVYRSLLDGQILSALGATPLVQITPVMVRAWHAGLDAAHPRQRSAAYSLLRTILNTAVADEAITSNPCRVRGAGVAKRARQIHPASVEELDQIAAAMPERYRLMVDIAAWCSLRFSELAELRRSDIELFRPGEEIRGGVIRVRRGIVDGDRGRVVKDPKSAAGKRDVHIPPHLLDAIREHLGLLPAGPGALLFPAPLGRQLSHTALYRMYHPAREAAGRPDLRFHDLRHTGNTFYALAGATLAEQMGYLGQSSVGAAMHYQHIARGRPEVLAEALSKLATVTPIDAKTRKRKEA